MQNPFKGIQMLRFNFQLFKDGKNSVKYQILTISSTSLLRLRTHFINKQRDIAFKIMFNFITRQTFIEINTRILISLLKNDTLKYDLMNIKHSEFNITW